MTGRPGLFLDRDGVVNEDTHFVHRKEDFVFCEGIFELVRTGLALGYVPVIVTNQSGIARGLFTECDFNALTAWMLSMFETESAPVAKVYHCPFLPDGHVAAYRHPDHPWRKPAPGMIHAARDELGLDLSRSALVGDRWSDALAGAAAGLPLLALIGDRADRESAPGPVPPVARLPNLRAAAAWLEASTRAKMPPAHTAGRP